MAAEEEDGICQSTEAGVFVQDNPGHNCVVLHCKWDNLQLWFERAVLLETFDKPTFSGCTTAKGNRFRTKDVFGYRSLLVWAVLQLFVHEINNL